MNSSVQSVFLLSCRQTTRNCKSELRRILDAIAFIPFEQCQPLSREFANIPARPGIYAIRHKTDGLLYIGKTKSLRGRFSGGHKAFLWAWLDKYSDEDVRVAMQPLSRATAKNWYGIQGDLKKAAALICQNENIRYLKVSDRSKS